MFACCTSLQNSKQQPSSGYIQLAKQLIYWHYINNLSTKVIEKGSTFQKVTNDYFEIKILINLSVSREVCTKPEKEIMYMCARGIQFFDWIQEPFRQCGIFVYSFYF